MLRRFLSVLAITLVVSAAIPVVYSMVMIFLLHVNHWEIDPLPTIEDAIAFEQRADTETDAEQRFDDLVNALSTYLHYSDDEEGVRRVTVKITEMHAQHPELRMRQGRAISLWWERKHIPHALEELETCLTAEVVDFSEFSTNPLLGAMLYDVQESQRKGEEQTDRDEALRLIRLALEHGARRNAFIGEYCTNEAPQTEDELRRVAEDVGGEGLLSLLRQSGILPQQMQKTPQPI